MSGDDLHSQANSELSIIYFILNFGIKVLGNQTQEPGSSDSFKTKNELALGY